MSALGGPAVEGAGAKNPAGEGPVVEAGTIAGNVYDKYGTSNPIARKLMDGFLGAARALAATTGVQELHEVGCGEGHLAVQLARWGYRVRGSDVGPTIISRARAHAVKAGVARPDAARPGDTGPEDAKAGLVTDLGVASIYDLDPEADSAALVVCCEVLEHLDDPEHALAVLRTLARPWLLVSVPREPIWRLANMARGRYLWALGNTPGHLNHWSKPGFLRLLAPYAEVVEVRSPFPWTMALCRVDGRGVGPTDPAPRARAANPSAGSDVGAA